MTNRYQSGWLALARNRIASGRQARADRLAALIDKRAINKRKLMAIAFDVPRYDFAPVPESEAPGHLSINQLATMPEADPEHIAEATETARATVMVEPDAMRIYADLQTALREYIRTYRHAKATRSTVGRVRKSLQRLDDALAELRETWEAADDRTKVQLTETVGEPPFQAWEPRPLTESMTPSDAWTRGAYRIAKFRQGAEWIAAGVGTLRQKYESADQDRPGADYPGLDHLTDRLAEVFTHYTKRRFSESRNYNSPVDFVTAVTATLPATCRPSGGSLIRAIRGTISRARIAATHSPSNREP